ncbi:MAG: Ig-like domain-containing protein [Candidatus Binatia bacterium]
MTVRGLAVLVALCFCLVTPAVQARCTGDCNASGSVAINELIIVVSIALGSTPVAACSYGLEPCEPVGDVCITIADIIRAVRDSLDGCPPEMLPALRTSDPSDGATNVPRTAWIRLEFAEAANPLDVPSDALSCASGGAARAHAVLPDVIVLNPIDLLPAGETCTIALPGQAPITFTVAPEGASPTVIYDRPASDGLLPFPDDFFLVADAATPTGRRVTVPLPAGRPATFEAIFGGLLPETNLNDGFSPIAHFVVELSEAPDLATLPSTPADSLNPLATVGLFDLDPDSPTFGARVPFRLEARTDTSVAEVVSHSLLVFPSIPLTPGGQYALVVSRRVLIDPSRPFGPSAAFAALLDPEAVSPGAEFDRLRAIVEPMLDELGASVTPPLARDDIALALRISIRSSDIIPRDQLAVKQQVLAAPPPAAQIDSVTPSDDPNLVAIVRGTWQAPEWRLPRSGMPARYFDRADDGTPRQTGSKAIPFTLALPRAALDGPVPLIMYQHGNPGSSEAEVPSAARRSLASLGFAVIGFTDVLNRELSPGATNPDTAILQQVAPVLDGIVSEQRVPEFWAQTRAEQLAFLRMLDGLGRLDVLPIDAPDGVPELAVDLPRGYLGISEGANNGPGFLPYAPEIRAAALVAGGARLGEVLIHQAANTFLTVLGAIYPSLTPAEIWLGLALFQANFDPQDAHNHARFLYREPLTVAGTTRKASILVIEGLEDSLVPNHATDSLAWAMGPIPHLLTIQRAVPFLDQAEGPLSGNIDAETTSAFYQYVPVGVEGIDPTPGCVVLSPTSANEGHYCAQGAVESFRQRAVFFTSALAGVPVIIDPLTDDTGSAGAITDTTMAH